MKLLTTFLLLVFSITTQAAEVFQGVQANKMLSTDPNATVLEQKRKIFYLKKPGSDKKIRKPKQVTIKLGEVLYITNNESKIVHNVYDETDDSWLLLRQEPGHVAAVKFKKKGAHNLKCAIHPKMKTTVTVE